MIVLALSMNQQMKSLGLKVLTLIVKQALIKGDKVSHIVMKIQIHVAKSAINRIHITSKKLLFSRTSWHIVVKDFLYIIYGSNRNIDFNRAYP